MPSTKKKDLASDVFNLTFGKQNLNQLMKQQQLAGSRLKEPHQNLLQKTDKLKKSLYQQFSQRASKRTLSLKTNSHSQQIKTPIINQKKQRRYSVFANRTNTKTQKTSKKPSKFAGDKKQNMKKLVQKQLLPYQEDLDEKLRAIKEASQQRILKLKAINEYREKKYNSRLIPKLQFQQMLFRERQKRHPNRIF